MCGVTRRLWAFVTAAVIGFVLPVAAQSTTGRISGTVTDSQGGVLPGVNVTALHDVTGVSKAAVTDQSGAYVFVNLPIGTYTVSAEMAGFQKSVRTNTTLVADGRVTADFTLQVGGVTEAVQVVSASETVNTTSGEIARVVDREQVQNLALNGRNYMQLATLIPGAPLLDDNALNIMTGLGINTSVNGSRTNASLLMVDGGFNLDSGSNNSQISNVGIDFIEEVNIKTANFSAEYGRNSGAAINVVTRSGTNAFRGSLFEYHPDEDFDANDYFSNSRSAAKPPLKYNNFGWSLGGPIQKGKLFFFAGQEWKLIRRSATPTLRTLPTRAMRAGDFSGIATVIRDPATGQPFPGNRIPAERITADGRAIANVYSQMEGLAATYDDRPITNNSLFGGDNPFDFRQDMIRADWQASQNHGLTLRIIHDTYDLVDPYGTFITSNLPTSQTNRRRPGRNYQIGHAWTISSNLINEFKANASWNSQRIPPVGDFWQRESCGFAYPQLFDNGDRFENSIPDTTITGYANFFGVARSLVSPSTDIQVNNHLSWLKGAHTLKVGGLVIRNRKDQNGRSLYAGNLTFATAGNSQTSGHAFADALLGNFRTYSEAAYDPLGLFRFWQTEAFVSDNWRVSRNLSIDAGLRYTWHQPIYTESNNMANFDPALYNPVQAVTVNRNGTLVPNSGNFYNGMIRVGDGVPDIELGRVPTGQDPFVLAVPAGAPRGLYDSRHLFGPRFSFAWTPTGNSDTAIRGGIGLFFDRPEGNLLFGGAGNGPVNSPPYILSSQYENGNLSSPGGGAVPMPAPLGTLAAIDPDPAGSTLMELEPQLPEGAAVGNLRRDRLRGQPGAASAAAARYQPAVIRRSGSERGAARRAAREHQLPASVQGLLRDSDAHLGRGFELPRDAVVRQPPSGPAPCDVQLHAGARVRQRQRQRRQPRGLPEQRLQPGAERFRSHAHRRRHVDLADAVLHRSDDDLGQDAGRVGIERHRTLSVRCAADRHRQHLDWRTPRRSRWRSLRRGISPIPSST